MVPSPHSMLICSASAHASVEGIVVSRVAVVVTMSLMVARRRNRSNIALCSSPQAYMIYSAGAVTSIGCIRVIRYTVVVAMSLSAYWWGRAITAGPTIDAVACASISAVIIQSGMLSAVLIGASIWNGTILSMESIVASAVATILCIRIGRLSTVGTISFITRLWWPC